MGADFRLKTPHFIDNHYRPEGYIVRNFQGVPGKHMEPLNKPAEQAAAGIEDAREEGMERQHQAAAGVDLNETAVVEGAAAAEAPPEDDGNDLV